MKTKIATCIKYYLVFAMAMMLTTVVLMSAFTYKQLYEVFEGTLMTDGAIYNGGLFETIELFKKSANEDYATHNQAFLDKAISVAQHKKDVYSATIKFNIDHNEQDVTITTIMHVNKDEVTGQIKAAVQSEEAETIYQCDFYSLLEGDSIKTEFTTTDGTTSTTYSEPEFSDNAAIDIIALLNGLREEETNWFPSLKNVGYAQIFGDYTLVVASEDSWEIEKVVAKTDAPQSILEALLLTSDPTLIEAAQKTQQENQDVKLSIEFSDWR